MLQRLIDLRDRAEQKLIERTSGSQSTFPIYGFLLYSATSLKLASVLEREVIKRSIEAITGNSMLFFLIEPLKYEEKFYGVGSSMLIREEVPVNAPARIFKALTGDTSEKLPALILTKRFPQMLKKSNKLVENFQRESVIVVSLEAGTENEFFSQMEEVLSIINDTTSSLAMEEQLNSETYFKTLQGRFRSYKRVRFVRKSVKALREILDLLGNVL